MQTDKKETEVKNKNGIGVTIEKCPILCVDTNQRSDDAITLEILDPEEYDTDLYIGDGIQLHFSNEQALRFAQQLIECAMQNVDEYFRKTWPDAMDLTNHGAME